MTAQPLMGPEEFTTLAQEFLRALEPTEENLAGFAGRVYRLGYEHGHRDGEQESAARFVANFKGGLGSDDEEGGSDE